MAKITVFEFLIQPHKMNVEHHLCENRMKILKGKAEKQTLKHDAVDTIPVASYEQKHNFLQFTSSDLSMNYFFQDR